MAQIQKGKQHRLIDGLWWKYPEIVMEEVANIMGVDIADTNTPGWFSKRTKAAKNILDRMNDSEMEKLRREVDAMATEGLPKEVQRK
jgi:hypothetical protein